MLISKTAKVHFYGWNKKHYKELGYDSKDEYIDVKIEDLPMNFTGNVIVKCDYCGKEFEREYLVYTRTHRTSPVQKDSCPNCIGKFRKESVQCTYGVSNVMELDEVKKKVENTNLDKYGSKAPSGNREVQKKIRQTNMERYGAPTPAQNKYILEKIMKTNIERYGSRCCMCSPEIKEKTSNTLREHQILGSIPCSKQQAYIHGLYGGILNYPIAGYYPDIMFEDDNIYFEYSGGGHDLRVRQNHVSEEDFNIYEETRRRVLLEHGYKEFEIISKKDKLPDDDFLVSLKEKAFDILKNTDYNYYGYNIDTNEEFYK